MKHVSFAQKTARKSTHIAGVETSSGLNGIAIAPPVYGIDVVDGQSVGVESEHSQAEQSLESTTWPAQSRPIQRQSAATETNSGSFGPNRPNRTGLPDKLKVGVETLSGMAMDDVRVHYNSTKPSQLQALAYTQGTDIHVGPGQERHLPHEAWHVVQQKQGRVKSTMQMNAANINDDAELEKEANLMGTKAILQAKCKNCSNDTIPPNILSVENGEELESTKQLSAINGNTTIQRVCGDKDASKFKHTDAPEYGGLSNDSGSCMDVLLTPASSGGSKVSSFPNWWPATGTSDRNVLNKYMVQGHLWNKELGGPGNTRKNLTPITASANSQHSAKVEDPLKKDLKPNTIVHYVVTADYSAVPKEDEIAPGNLADQNVIKKYVGNMAQGIHAEYTVYNATTLAQIKSNSWDIGNEHSSIV